MTSSNETTIQDTCAVCQREFAMTWACWWDGHGVAICDECADWLWTLPDINQPNTCKADDNAL
jgi:hypothetical protein